MLPLIIFLLPFVMLLFVSAISGNTAVYILETLSLPLTIGSAGYTVLYLYFTSRRINDIGISRAKAMPFLIFFILLVPARRLLYIFPIPILILKAMFVVFIICQLFLLLTPPLKK